MSPTSVESSLGARGLGESMSSQRVGVDRLSPHLCSPASLDGAMNQLGVVVLRDHWHSPDADGAFAGGVRGQYASFVARKLPRLKPPTA